MHSVKWKLTLLYTFFMTLLVCLLLAILLSLSSSELLSSVQQQIKEHVYDSLEDIRYDGQELYIDSNIMDVNNGIYMSVYDSNGKFIYGRLPYSFSARPAFQDGNLQTIDDGSTRWYIFDVVQTINGYGSLFVRGIVSVSDAEQSMRIMLRTSLIILPALVILAAIFGYLFIGRTLRPVNTMIKTVQEIQEGSDLSKRIPLTRGGDEFHRLAECFNQMLSSLESAFQRERQFTSDVSHELRTPVAVILSHCEYLLEQKTLPSEIRQEMEIIQTRAKGMAQMNAQLLLLSRADQNRQPLHFEQVNLTDLLEIILEEQQEDAGEKQIELQSRLAPDVTMTADETMMIRLFENLLTNAIRYGREHGWVQVTMNTDGEAAEVSVKDNGIGISKEHLPHIWERFYQADPSRSDSRQGAGLGLPMVQWIVRAHHGTIQVQSLEGVGTEFILRLPLRQPTDKVPDAFQPSQRQGVPPAEPPQ